MAVSQKKLKNDIRQLIQRKQKIFQPGRLVAHVTNELKLNGDSLMRDPIIAALEALEEEGIIVIERSGNVMNGMERTDRRRARSMSNPARKQQSAANQNGQPAITKAPAVTHVHETPSVALYEEPTTAPEPQTTESSIEEKVVEITELEVSTGEPTDSADQQDSELDMVENLVKRIEKLKGDLKKVSRERDELLSEKLSMRQQHEAALAAKEVELETQREAYAQLNENFVAAQQSLEEGTAVLRSMIDEKNAREAQDRAREAEESKMARLAARVAAALQED